MVHKMDSDYDSDLYFIEARQEETSSGEEEIAITSSITKKESSFNHVRFTPKHLEVERSSADCYGEISDVVTNKSPSIDWWTYGIKLELKPSIEVDSEYKYDISIKIVPEYNFTFPDGWEPVSAVYSILIPKSYTGSITVKIKHFVKFDDSSTLKFARTSSQSPMKFDLLDGGFFQVGADFGEITKKRLCSWVVVAYRWLVDLWANTYKGVICYALYPNNNWTMFLPVVKDTPNCNIALNLYLTKIKEGCDTAPYLMVYCDPTAEFAFKFSDENDGFLELKPNYNTSHNGWVIRHEVSKVLKRAVDRFGSRFLFASTSTIPAMCIIEVYPVQDCIQNLRRIDHCVSFHGITESTRSGITINPPAPNRGIPYATSEGLEKHKKGIGSLLTEAQGLHKKAILFLVGNFELRGALIDVENMEEVFKRMNYVVDRQGRISSSQQLLCLIEAAAKFDYPRTCKLIVFYFVGHGGIDIHGNQYIVPITKERLLINRILTAFRDRPSKYSERIPCLFFFDCCFTGEDGRTVYYINKSSMPMNSIVAYSTSIGLRSYGERTKGGLWTSLLLDTLNTQPHSDSVTTILDKTQERVSQKLHKMKIEILEKLATDYEACEDETRVAEKLKKLNNHDFFQALQEGRIPEGRIPGRWIEEIAKIWSLQIPCYENNAYGPVYFYT